MNKKILTLVLLIFLTVAAFILLMVYGYLGMKEKEKNNESLTETEINNNDLTEITTTVNANENNENIDLSQTDVIIGYRYSADNDLRKSSERSVINLPYETASLLEDYTIENVENSEIYNIDGFSWKYNINAVGITEEVPEGFKNEYLLQTESFGEIDENGNMSQDCVFLLVNVTIQNMLEEERDYLFTSFWLEMLNEEMWHVNLGNEIRMFAGEDKNKGKDRVYRKFSSKEAFTCDLVFIAKRDEIANYDGWLVIDNRGFGAFTEDKIVLKIFNKGEYNIWQK